MMGLFLKYSCWLVAVNYFCEKLHLRESGIYSESTKIYGRLSIWYKNRRVSRRCSIKKVFLEISQNSQENTCTRVSFFNKVAGLRPVTLLKERVWHRCFPVNFAKFVEHLFLQNTSGSCFWQKHVKMIAPWVNMSENFFFCWGK